MILSRTLHRSKRLDQRHGGILIASKAACKALSLLNICQNKAAKMPPISHTFSVRTASMLYRLGNSGLMARSFFQVVAHAARGL